MTFNSIEFILFGGIFFLFWPLAKKKNSSRWLYIVIASFIFYGWWDWRFLFLLIFTGLIDYAAGLLIEAKPQYKKTFLILSMLSNVLSLAIFKYSGFLAENIDAFFFSFGYSLQLKNNLPDFTLILPIGISFYTFQSMSYTIDVYRGLLKPTKNILHFFSFLALFPQLVAGPIVRATDLLFQLEKNLKTNEAMRWRGLELITFGFFKKMVIADNLAPMVNYAFALNDTSGSAAYWWVVITAFAFQIYFDFSGYSDIARGLAKWMGYNFKINFNHPYISLSLKEFWTRWHISLSGWFKDYVYIPLGGSRRGKIKSHTNMWIAMVISGLWHGAAWTFLTWGALHAFYLSLERLIKWPEKLKNNLIMKTFIWLFVMVEVWISWVFFRAENFNQAFHIIKRMFSFDLNFGKIGQPNSIFYLLVGIIFEVYLIILAKKALPEAMIKYEKTMQIIIVATLITACVFLRGEQTKFIYFQF